MAIKEDDRTSNQLTLNTTILAIDSSTFICSVALMKQNEIIAEYSLSLPNIHDFVLAELVRRILADCEITVEEIDALAISSGPGSFTGLRIGASIAKGICFDNKIKLLPIETLFSVAYAAKKIANLFKAKRILVAIPSYKDLMYTQFFSTNAEPLSKVEIQTETQVETGILPNDLVCGSPNNNFSKGINVGKYFFPSARFVAISGLDMFHQGKYIPAENFIPKYFQEFIPKLIKK